MIERIIYVPFDHLNLSHGALAKANPKTDLVVLVESKRMVTGRDWHKERLFFMISSARSQRISSSIHKGREHHCWA